MVDDVQQRGLGVEEFNYQFFEGIIKKILWPLRLWVGRRYEPLLSFMAKPDEGWGFKIPAAVFSIMKLQQIQI